MGEIRKQKMSKIKTKGDSVKSKRGDEENEEIRTVGGKAGETQRG